MSTLVFLILLFVVILSLGDALDLFYSQEELETMGICRGKIQTS